MRPTHPRFRQILNILPPKTSQNYQSFLLRSTDLPSLEEFVNTHMGYLFSNKDIKRVNTTDPKTYDIYRNIFKNLDSVEEKEFFEKTTISQPDAMPNECRSIKILVSDIKDFPDYRTEFFDNKGVDKMLCVGGPAAEDQVIMANLIPKIKEKLKKTTYITRDYKESNSNHSAKQLHARHGNALNADRNLTGRNLLPILLWRKILGVNLEDVLKPDYRKINISKIDPKKLRIYFGNELNSLKQVYKKYKNNKELTEHDINRLESILSREILHAIEQETGVSVSGNHKELKDNLSSIHLVFTEEDKESVQHENKEFEKVGIKSEELSAQEIKLLFGSNKHIITAYRYPGDTRLKFNAHEINAKLAQEKGVKWIEGAEIQRILVRKNDKGNAEVAGVVNSKGEFIYCNKLHFTGGYKVDYIFDPESKSRFNGSFLRNNLNHIQDNLGLQKPLSNEITTATGVSINAIFKKSDRLKQIIEKYGSTGELSTTNSHWTMLAQNDKYIVMRITGGGNTGSEEYNPAYFLNIIANTRRIFGDDLIGIASSYGCPRAINAKNTTEFAIFAEGGVISYGKGGTGNTKRHAEAAFALMMTGFEQEVIDYFNKFKTEKDEPLGDELKKIYGYIKECFVHNNIERTNRRMGYSNTYSVGEKAAIGIFLALLGAGIGTYYAKRSNKPPSPEDKEGRAGKMESKTPPPANDTSSQYTTISHAELETLRRAAKANKQALSVS